MPSYTTVPGPDGRPLFNDGDYQAFARDRHEAAESAARERRAAAARAKAEADLAAALDRAEQRRLAARVAEVERLAREAAAARALVECRERLISQGLELSPEATLEDMTAAALAAIEARAASGAKGSRI